MKRGVLALGAPFWRRLRRLGLREPLNVTIADLKPIESACSSSDTP